MLHIMQHDPTPRRFTGAHPCPVCNGHDGLGRGRGVRCFGYLDDTGRYARCTREDKAGRLRQNTDGTYSHRLNGQCRCGHTHGDASILPSEAPPPLRRKRPPQRFRTYFTLAAFLRRRYGSGTIVRYWVYTDGSGQEVFRIIRGDHRLADGTIAKTYRPCHRDEDGRWRLAKPAGPLPLYNLPALLTAPEEPVTIFEGEKCADIAASLGLSCATTSAHGARAPQLTDWSPLAGRRVIILPDADDDGPQYAEKVTAILATLDPPAKASTVHLPGLADGDDIEQWAAFRRGAGLNDAAILVELQALIESSFG
jgi:hypothetical protein